MFISQAAFSKVALGGHKNGERRGRKRRGEGREVGEGERERRGRGRGRGEGKGKGEKRRRRGRKLDELRVDQGGAALRYMCTLKF